VEEEHVLGNERHRSADVGAPETPEIGAVEGSAPNTKFDDELGAAFDKQYQEKFGKYEAPYHGHAYDAANLLLNAIKQVAVQDKEGNLYIGRQALRDALYATKDFRGITGSLTCDENGDCADPEIVINQVKDGEFVPVWSEAEGWLNK